MGPGHGYLGLIMKRFLFILLLLAPIKSFSASVGFNTSTKQTSPTDLKYNADTVNASGSIYGPNLVGMLKNTITPVAGNLIVYTSTDKTNTAPTTNITANASGDLTVVTLNTGGGAQTNGSVTWFGTSGGSVTITNNSTNITRVFLPAIMNSGLWFFQQIGSTTNYNLTNAVAGSNISISSEGVISASGGSYVYTIPIGTPVSANITATTYYLGNQSGLNSVQGRYVMAVPITGHVIGYAIHFRTGTTTTAPTGNTLDLWLNNAQVPGGQYSLTWTASSVIATFQSCTSTAVSVNDLLEVRAIFGGSPSGAALSAVQFNVMIQVP